jgi:hypothetical protein
MTPTELWSGYTEGWDNLLPWGATTNQQPWEYSLKLLVPGQELDSADSYAGVDEAPVITTATVVPECVHKHRSQLPASEQAGGVDALLLVWRGSNAVVRRACCWLGNDQSARARALEPVPSRRLLAGRGRVEAENRPPARGGMADVWRRV